MALTHNRYFLASCLGAIVFGGTGCISEDSNSSGPEEVQFTFPSSQSVSVEENNTVNYQLQATGGSDLTFELVQTPDAAWFSIDSSTGVLTSTQPFDFEKPLDADANNTYSLEVIASITDQRSIADVLVTIDNTSDLALVIDFPPNLANTGGFASDIAMRGGIIDDSGNRLSNVDGVELTIDGTPISLSNEIAGQWMVDLALASEVNAFDVVLAQNDKVFESIQWTINNKPIAETAETWAVTPNPQITYAPALGKQGILMLDEQAKSASTLISPQRLREFNPRCHRIDELLALANGQKLLIRCSADGDGGVVAVYDTQLEQLTELMNVQQSSGFTAIDQQYAIFWLENDPDTVSFDSDVVYTSVLGLVDVTTSEAFRLNIAYPEETRIFNPFNLAVGNDRIEFANGYGIDYSDLFDAQGNGTASSIMASGLPYRVERSGKLQNSFSFGYNFVVKDDADYIFNGNIIDGFTVIRRDFFGTFIDEFPISFEFAPAQATTTVSIEPLEDNRIVVKNDATREVQIFDSTDNRLLTREVFGSQEYMTLGDAPYAVVDSQTGNELVYFHPSLKELRWVSKSTFATVKTQALPALEDIFMEWSSFTLNENSESIYVASKLDWWNVNESGKAVITQVSYKADNEFSEGILYDEQIAALLGHEQGVYFYGLTSVHFDKSRNALFTIVTAEDSWLDGAFGADDNLHVLMEYDLATGTWSILRRLEDVGQDPSVALIGSDVEGLFALLHWPNNKVVICENYCESTEIITLTSGNFITSLSFKGKTKELYYSVSDAQTNAIAPVNLVKYDLATKAQSVISTLDNAGPMMEGCCDLIRDDGLLLVNVSGYQMLLDAASGDRVIMPAQ